MLTNFFKFSLFAVLMFSAVSFLKAQDITLEECHQLAKQNYPAIQKLCLIDKTTELDLENAGKGYLPQINFTGKATYQSEVTDYSDLLGNVGMNISLPEFSKDQYKIQGEVTQLIFDGGNIQNKKEFIQANSELEKQNIEAQIYSVKERINHLFFSVLLMDAQLEQNEINKSTLETQAEKTEVQLKNGVAFRSNLNELKAEIVNIDMKSTEFIAHRKSYLKMLSLFIGKDLPENTTLEAPLIENISYTNKRPELRAFDLQKAIFDVQEKQLKSTLLPKVNAFFLGAYGRPNLNAFSNEFRPWWMTGVQFSWSLESLYTRKNKKEILNFNREKVDADRDTFLFNSHLDLSQQNEEIRKYNQLILQDNQVIELRESVTQSAMAQLSNGVITTHEYIQKLNAENAAKQSKILHEIQLLQAQYKQKFITGN